MIKLCLLFILYQKKEELYCKILRKKGSNLQLTILYELCKRSPLESFINAQYKTPNSIFILEPKKGI